MALLRRIKSDQDRLNEQIHINNNKRAKQGRKDALKYEYQTKMLQSQIKELQSERTELQTRVTQLESELIALKPMLKGLEKKDR